MDWLVRPFVRQEDTPHDITSKKFVVTYSYCLICVSVVFCTVAQTVPSDVLWGFDAGSDDLQFTFYTVLIAYSFVIHVYDLLHMFLWGLTRVLKVVAILNHFCWLTLAGICFGKGNWHFFYVLVLDFCLLARTEGDASMLDGLSGLLCVALTAYITLHVLATSGLGPDIHPSYENEMAHSPIVGFTVGVMPILLNFVFVRSYAVSSRKEAKSMEEAVKIATRIAEHLANFDVDSAETLLKQDFSSPMQKPLSHLLRNLRSYRPFLPRSLFLTEDRVQLDEECQLPNETLAKSMMGQTTSWNHAQSAAYRLRDRDYSLKEFSNDVEIAFPELSLYGVSDEGEQRVSVSRSNKHGNEFSSGLSGVEEFQRTMGAMYSVYCLARLDIDGKEIFSFGVDQYWKPRRAGAGDAADRRQAFYNAMDWGAMTQLMLRSELLKIDSRKNIVVNTDRMLAFLVLTAVHDIMKNSVLLPVVQKKHSPYKDLHEGCCISDHDVALAYIMENFPSLLPSFQYLEPGQRAPVLFTQSKMGFNNGWLVQGEAPPGALFTDFKRVIVEGGASESDISFYFAHWLTDLAGAEPYKLAPWPGSEKFVLKFPSKVLSAFLKSFSFVDHLASKSEVQVMEEYLEDRWLALGPPSTSVPDHCRLAAMRLALMAQGFEAEAVLALEALPKPDRDVIATEMARTGHRSQFHSAPNQLVAPAAGPALLVYYAPALIQKAGAAQISGALFVLAAVYRAARELFPLQEGAAAVEKTAVIRIDGLKVMTPSEIFASGEWRLQKNSESDAEAMRGPVLLESESSAISTRAESAILDLMN